MDFELSQEQYAVRDTFSRFCDERIAPRAEAIDEAHEFPWELFRELGEMGFFGMRYPEEDGGSGICGNGERRAESIGAAGLAA